MSRMLPQPKSDSIELTTVLAALADPVRLEMMRALHRQAEPVNCSVLVRNTGIEVTPPTMSHHWKTLRAAGLTSTEVVGRERIITIRAEELEQRFPGLLRSVLDADT
ncbi:ArsR/SmtB family transcription factor [Microlunatus soli]|uniref:DNA-binding transcriptional regulator, ArsR family n=1 Tax=Microlunatus soli TaxID=630515 RepID=A0A1H1SRV2_9ACTN|nr:helix-turn-helix domain-containing protein [Microlunatus soli]SDS50588.1 DNA-binding transcriptional regulator, ArsR family [Microlunatus soli]